jgi:hypothetical protein
MTTGGRAAQSWMRICGDTSPSALALQQLLHPAAALLLPQARQCLRRAAQVCERRRPRRQRYLRRSCDWLYTATGASRRGRSRNNATTAAPLGTAVADAA